MKVLVTGGAGYIGSNMVYNLIDKGFKVEVIDNLSTGKKSQLPKNIKLHLTDIGNFDIVDKILHQGKFDAVIHFAASIVVPESVINPIKYYSNNTFQTLNFLRACVKNKIEKFIFSSTAAVYEGKSKKNLNEESITNPSSPYGMSKLMSENMIKDICTLNNISFIIFRYFNVAGADKLLRCGQQNKLATHLIKVGCEVALKKRNYLSIFGNDFETFDGTGVRDYIHVQDLVDAHFEGLKYMNNHNTTNLVLNCGYSRGFSVNQVVKQFKSILSSQGSNVTFKTRVAPRRLGDPAYIVSDNSLILKTLSWKPKFDSLETIISDSLEWEKIL